MKTKKLLFFILTSLLSLSFILSSCAGGNDKPAETIPEETVAETEAEPTYKRPDKFPKDIDFDDEEAIYNMFDVSDVVDGVTVSVNKKAKMIIQKATIHDVKFSLSIGLSKWAKLTTPEQIANCAQLFWYCYPQMYFRLHNDGSPTSLALNFENEGYEVASCGGNQVHIHDNWLHEHPTDYDCLTHEFAHAIQGGWYGAFSPSYGEDTYMIERFADYCRYVYAYNVGYYNDRGWELQTVRSEDTYWKSVRFWVWIDYTYSTDSIDIMQRINYYVQKGGKEAIRTNWETSGPMWDKVFKGTGAEGKTIDELFSLYKADEFSKLDALSAKLGGKSRLLNKFDIRTTIKGRPAGADDYVKLGK